MAKKIKLSDAAKDINISSKELVEFFASKGDTKKNLHLHSVRRR